MKRHLILGISSSVLGLLLVGLVVWGLSFNATHTQAAAPAAPQQVFWEEDFSAALPPDKYFITGTYGSGVVDLETFLVTQPAMSQRGRIFYITPTLMIEFDTTFSLRLGDLPDGADGVAFNICPTYDYPPDVGGTLDASCPGGYIVAFDTYDAAPATVYLAKDNVFNRLRTADLQNSLEDSQWHDAEVVLNQGTITVTLDNVDVIAGFPIPDYEPFTGYFGFSGATGALYNSQRVDDIQVEAEFLPPGYLDGHVYDADTLTPIEGATVTADRLGGGDWSSATDASGYYSMTVATGIYTVTAEHDLYFPVSVPEVEVLQEAVTTVDFSLTAKVALEPSPVHVTLDWGTTAQLDASLINNMDADYEFELSEWEEGFLPMVVTGATFKDIERVGLDLDNELEVESIQGGKIAWLYRDTQGVEVNTSDNGSTIAYPGAYKFIPNKPSTQANILVYADDWVHVAPNTLVQQALSILGLPATVHVDGDYLGFVNNLNIGGPWDLVIYSSENFPPPSTVKPALVSYLQGGGKLAATDWYQRIYPSDPLWAEMGFVYLANYLDPKPAYWWEPSNQIFNIPTDAPEWLVRTAPSGNSQGTIIDPLAGSRMLGGYTPSVQPDQGALVIRGDGRSIYKAIRDITIDADADSDGVNDGTELWENIIYGLLHGFDIPWLAEYPTSGTVLANSSLDIGLSFTATLEAGVSQPGDYFGTLQVIGNPSIDIPVTMTVLPSPDMGKLTGTILDNCTGEPVRAEIGIAGGYPITQTMSDPDTGAYSAWLVEGSYELTLSAMDYITQTESVDISGGETTLLDISLVPDRSCIAVEPIELEAWVLQDTEVYTHHTGLDISNHGGQDLEFNIQEISGSVGLNTSLAQPIDRNNNITRSGLEVSGRIAASQVNVQGNECIVAVTLGGSTETTELNNTLTELGYNWLNVNSMQAATDAGANILIAHNSGQQWNPLPSEVDGWLNAGNGYVEVGDLAMWFPDSIEFVMTRQSPITITVANPNHPLTSGLPASWTSLGFWSYENIGFNVISWVIDPSYPDLVHSQYTTLHGRAVTVKEVGDGRAAYIGFNAYGSLAGPADKRLLDNAISWSGDCGFEDVPWVWEEPISGTVPALSTTHVDILFTSVVTDPLPLGTYTATLYVAENDPVVQNTGLPVVMHVVSEYTTPSAAFETNAPVCPGAEVLFTNTTLAGIPPVNTYQWNFGDGASSTEENPAHLYAAAGVYEVTLEACNIEGLCDTASASVEVLGLPQANFSYDAEGVAVSFTNLSLYATDYNWSFGDGTNSTAVNPIHSYPAIGTYTVALAAMGVCGDDEFSTQVKAGSFIYLPVITKEIQP
jgi:PKD domain/Carboxypeptidase regulatory-like domain/Bacterial lectin